jgi:phosphate-selective porin
MLVKGIGPHRLAVRYDDFEVEFEPDRTGSGNEDGHAWTLAYAFEPDESWRFMLEWLRVSSDVGARTALLGEPGFATESKVELSVRYAISGVF